MSPSLPLVLNLGRLLIMARYHAEIHVVTPPEQAFTYLANFANSQEWDPGVVRAELITPGPVGSGSEFDVVTGSARRTIDFRYRIIDFDQPRRVVLRGTAARLVSTDQIDVAAAEDGGSMITYDADLRLSGVWRILDLPLSLAFRRIGDRAIEGLRSAFELPVERRI